MLSDIALELVLILPLILILVYLLGGILFKFLQKYTNDFWFFYYFIPRHVKRPECRLSKYYNRFPVKSGDYWSYAPTIDDPFLIELAQNINKKIGSRSQRYKAGYILKLVQFGYTYKSDTKLYGQREKWAFPVCTQLLHQGDCEDGALLGAGLSKLCGVDVVMVSVKGHALYAVNVNGFGMKVKHDGKKYLLCETTAVLPLGICLSEKELRGTYDVLDPPEDYIERYTTYDTFDKYPLN